MSSLRQLYAEIVTQVVESENTSMVPRSTSYTEENPRDNITEAAEVGIEIEDSTVRVEFRPDSEKIRVHGGFLNGQSAVLEVEEDFYVVGYFNGDPSFGPEQFGDAREAARAILGRITERSTHG